TLDLKERWRFPRGNVIRVKDVDGDYFYSASPFCHTRVKATWADLLNPDRYEAFAFDPATSEYRWQRDTAPTTQADEQKLLQAGKLPAERVRYQFADATGGPVR